MEGPHALDLKDYLLERGFRLDIAVSDEATTTADEVLNFDAIEAIWKRDTSDLDARRAAANAVIFRRVTGRDAPSLIIC